MLRVVVVVVDVVDVVVEKGVETSCRFTADASTPPSGFVRMRNKRELWPLFFSQLLNWTILYNELCLST